MSSQTPEAIFPLSFSQESMWFLHQLDPSIPAYNTIFLLELIGPLDVSLLEKSLNEIIRRHATLRSIFPAENGVPRQVVLPFKARPLPVLDYADVSAGQRPEKAIAFVTQESDQPIDIASGPVFRPALLAFAPEDNFLVIHVHHIVIDGWSDMLILKELAGIYTALSRGEKATLPDLKMQYGDYVRWQKEWMQGERLDEYLGYWKNKLGGTLPVLELPTDHPRPHQQTYNGERLFVLLSPALASGLKALCRKERLTLFMVLLAALKTLLFRYTGQEDVIVGSPFANRYPEETEEIIGYFVNTLPLRTDLSGDPSFLELLARVRNTVLDAFRYQALPFERIVEDLRLERSLSRTPVFQVVMNMVNVPARPDTAGDLQIKSVTYERKVIAFDLLIEIHDRKGGIEISFSANADLFDRPTIERLSAHFIKLLESAVAAPQTKISALPLLTEAERAQLAAWNETRTVYPAETGIQRLFESRVAEDPQRPAVFSDDMSLSYGELNQRANRLAHYLKSFDLRPGEPVALCVERTPDAAVGALAILKAGGAYMPIDPSYPQERIDFMLRDSGARLMLTQQSLQAGLGNLPVRPVCIDDLEPYAGLSEQNPPSSTGGVETACIFYTSGSTGRPKGVLVPHRSIVRLLVNTDYIHVRSSDVFGQVSNLAFDAFSFELWGALLNGASLAFIPYLISLSPRDFAARLARDSVTVMFMTATLFNLVAQQVPTAFAGMRYLLVGGEQLDPGPVRQVVKDGKPEVLMNGYGPTETATFACTFRIESVSEDATHIPIGKPIANTTCHVLDPNLSPVPVGVTGELFIGGDAVTKGYLNRPDLTAEKFIPDPFRSDPDARLYRTGDQVRRLPDGNIVLLGRLDNQVKIRGFRVEPGEVEVVLKQHPAVRDAVVVLQKIPAGNQLAAFYLSTRSEDTSAELRDYLKSRLPDYMVPAVFSILDSFPLTPSGKVDRLALADRLLGGSSLAYVPPHDTVEVRLVEIWQRILGVERVGMSDNFFDLGGHSLLAARLFAEIEKEFACALPLAALFEYGTVADIARLIKSNPSARVWPVLIPMQVEGTKPPIFLAPGGGGGVFYLRDLVKNIGADHPVYGLQSIQPDLRSQGLMTIPELAEVYLRAIRECQPHGPYYLIGHSTGGTIVFEIACKLLQDGGQVGLLGLLDTYPPGSQERIILPKRMPLYWQNFVDAGGTKERLQYLGERIQRLFIRLIRHTPLLNLAARAGLIPKDRYLVSSLTEANYRPPFFDATLTIFRVQERPRDERADPLKIWNEYARQVEIVEVPGNHKTLLSDPNVQELARRIRERLGSKEGG